MIIEELNLKGANHPDKIYYDNTIDSFMEKSYKFMLESEEKIRSQML
jgi:hypothetical protein